MTEDKLNKIYIILKDFPELSPVFNKDGAVVDLHGALTPRRCRELQQRKYGVPIVVEKKNG